MIPTYIRTDAASNSKPRKGRLSRLPLMPRKARMPGSIPAAHPAHPLMSAVITLRKPVEPWSARDAEKDDESIVWYEESCRRCLVGIDKIWLSVEVVCKEKKKKGGAGEDG